MADVLRLLRPLQWAKNGLVFLPFLFAVDIAWSVESAGNVPELLFRLLLVFLGFCGMASGVYVLNDLMDREADRRHPTKRNRPIASGRVGAPVAVALMAMLTGAGLAVSWYVGQLLGLVGLIYIAINVGYSLGGKNIPLLDVFAVASGYVIRAAAGARRPQCAMVPPSLSAPFRMRPAALPEPVLRPGQEPFRPARRRPV